MLETVTGTSGKSNKVSVFECTYIWVKVFTQGYRNMHTGSMDLKESRI